MQALPPNHKSTFVHLREGALLVHFELLTPMDYRRKVEVIIGFVNLLALNVLVYFLSPPEESLKTVH